MLTREELIVMAEARMRIGVRLHDIALDLAMEYDTIAEEALADREVAKTFLYEVREWSSQANAIIKAAYDGLDKAGY
jgi:hypothetical protein